MPPAGLCVSRHTVLVAMHHSYNAPGRPVCLKIHSPGSSTPFSQCRKQASASQKCAALVAVHHSRSAPARPLCPKTHSPGNSILSEPHLCVSRYPFVVNNPRLSMGVPPHRCVSRYTVLVTVHHSRNAASRRLCLQIHSPGNSAPFAQCPRQASVFQDTHSW